LSELLIRPGPNDHEVIQDLLAPGGAAVFLPRTRPLIDRLVVDAHVADARQEFADAATAAGVPVLVDPLTPFWQGELRERDKWALLPFGRSDKLDPMDLSNPFVKETLVSQVVDFQIGHGATAIIPPYPYVTSPADPFFDLALDFLRITARYMRQSGLALPVLPVLCAQLKGFGTEKTWVTGIDRFANAALDLGPEAIGVCMSPAGAGNDSYNKVLGLFRATRRVKQTGARVIAWRQGVYGSGGRRPGRLRNRRRHARVVQRFEFDRQPQTAEAGPEARRRRGARNLPRAASPQRLVTRWRDAARSPLDEAEGHVRRRALLPERRS
jgi:hypothetical protein